MTWTARSCRSCEFHASDAGGRQYWINQLATGSSLRTFRAKLFGSTEYFNKFGGGTNAGYVQAAYNDVLGRQPDAGAWRSGWAS